MTNKMNNPITQQSPALRMEAGSINCIVGEVFTNSTNRNLLTVAESLPAQYFDYLFLMRLIILIHIIRRTPRDSTDGGETTAREYFDVLGRSVRKESPGVQGKPIVETTEYDAKGQVTRKSSPYLDGLETPVYTTYTYHPQDGYVTKVTNPDGSYSVPTYTGFNEKMESYAAEGDFYYNSGQYKLALTIYEKAIEQYPFNPMVKMKYQEMVSKMKGFNSNKADSKQSESIPIQPLGLQGGNPDSMQSLTDKNKVVNSSLSRTDLLLTIVCLQNFVLLLFLFLRLPNKK